ncbi:arylsulfatase [Dawidia soli]|uniref:Arylsulfatase n=1 Tax=Dawidia soli TaxID=2782352 RepID=A0AAP2GIN6_9BACT|nr:arylsulfatase [Dawidia soli]MBT1688506.1 arylsulfatase [Dawidia soli]
MKSIGIFIAVCLFPLSVAAQQRPNIVLILADDMGYSDLSSYGGEVSTPHLDKLASGGIRYKQFYNAARCCPTRASLMTGVYPHQAGMGWMAAADLGTPPYQGNLNNHCVTIAEVLKSAGYGTYMAGKWHLTNERKIDGMVTDSWPKQRGFDRYFGIIPGGSNYFTPVIYSNNDRYPAPAGFYLTNAISDTTVHYIDRHFAQRKNTPMFMYVAYTAPHWPLHALQKEIDKYKKRYLAGWDKIRQERFERQMKLGVIPKGTLLSPRDQQVESWESLSEEKRNEMAMRMAIYAAQIDIMDQGIGRIVAKLKEKEQLDNTLILFLSDNGACAEFISSGQSKVVNGKEDTFESYRMPWANVGSTPFREYKHYTHEGGIATPLIAHWPAGIEREFNNTFVKEYGHVSDIMATCVDVAGATYPARYKGNAITPLEGKSLVPHFTGHSNNRGVVYWEHEANIAMRDGKWKLVASTPEDKGFSKESLELFDMEADPSEMKNLASKYPDRVNAMYDNWLTWANKIGAFPLDTRGYGKRMEVYRRTVNGSFDDNLGGWNIKQNNTAEGMVMLDTTGQLTGRNAAKVTMLKPGDKSNGLVMIWNVKLGQGQTYQVKFRSKATRSTTFIMRMEMQNSKGEKLVDEEITTSNHAISSASRDFEIPKNGAYQIAFYFGKLRTGDVVWIDDVELVPVTK